MYCRKCGKEIRDDSLFCQFCGEKVEPIESVQQPEENTSLEKEILEEASIIQELEEPEVNTFVDEIVESVNDNESQGSFHFEYSSQDEKQPNGTKGFKIIGIIVIAMIVVGLALCFIGNMMNSKKAVKEDKIEEVEKEDKEELEKQEEKKKEEEEKKKQEEEEKKKQEEEEKKKQEEQKAAVESAPAPAQNYSEYIIPDSSTRIISESELYGLSADECCFARNEIYARHHRLFVTDYIQAHFYSCSWYEGYIQPDAFTPDMLNEVETINVATILSYEQRMGWQ